MAFEPGDLWSAWTTCRSTREGQLFSDPLMHAEFEIADVPPSSDFTLERVEVDVCTRPKHSGGVRTELFPDAHTSTLVQAVADRLRLRDTSAATSAPRAPHSVRLAANQYEEWSSDVRTWIRKELAAGRIVVYADIENFFPSIPAPAVAGILERSGLDPDIEGLTFARSRSAAEAWALLCGVRRGAAGVSGRFLLARRRPGPSQRRYGHSIGRPTSSGTHAGATTSSCLRGRAPRARRCAVSLRAPTKTGSG